MKISILCSDTKHPVYEFLAKWTQENSSHHDITLFCDKNDLCGGNLLFLVSCNELVEDKIRSTYHYTLVLHASDLPKGRGWSPHIWELLEGAEQITLTLLEADHEIDAGRIWKKMVLDIPKHLLFEEINQILFEAELSLMDFAIKYFGEIKAQEQDSKIAPTYYPKRKPENSSLDPDDTIANQFDIIRLSDPIRYPPFFRLHGKKYKIIIEKLDE